MSESANAQPRLQVPQRTSPTWEIELLISGAVVFSLFSLRQPLEDFFAQHWPVATPTLLPLVLYGYLYAKLVLFVLLITFVLHLAARARWVALVGVHSIYPRGPVWDNLGGGPLTRRLTQEMVGDLDEAIERADNQSSLVFGYDIMAAQLSLMIMFVSLLFIGLLAALRTAGLGEEQEAALVFVLLAALLLPMLVDKYLLPRLRQDHWLVRPTDRMLRMSFWVTLSRLQQPLNSLITTNLGGRRGPWVLVAVIYAVLALATLDTYQRIDRGVSLRGDALAESGRDFGLYPAHYAVHRQGLLRQSSAPFIPAEVVRGPYLRLTLPYQARRHDRLLASACPLAAISGEDATQRRAAQRAAQQAQTDCFGRLFDIRLDGRPLRNLEFHRLQGLDEAPDGVVTMIDVRTLAPGRHTLQLAHLDQPERSGTPDPAAAEPHLIEFWR